ncbi:HEPN domain-containing protein [Tsukamurella pulmonis]|uniref:HEPN domain-containing protein n=1 Tax=Tsukamurella pulmonis TaxID=47312 RepID=UPI000E09C313|nr:HEPN domain-containing protein [Tsukamurella pulmonis]
MTVDSPIHPRLWAVTLPAVRAARDALVAYAADNFVPRTEVRVFKVNDAGWPAVVDGGRLSTSRDDPINWRRGLSLRPGELSYVVVDDVPELATALGVVRAMAEEDEAFGSSIDPLYGGRAEGRADDYLGHSYLSFVGSMIERMESTGASEDSDLLAIYGQLERARFATELRGDLVVPITLTDFGTPGTIHLDEDVYLEQLTPETQCARATDPLSNTNAYLVAAATHALVVRDITIDNSVFVNRLYGRFRGLHPIDDADMAKVDRLVQCVHFVSGRATGYNQVLVRPTDWSDGWHLDLPAVWEVETVQRFPTGSHRARWNEEREPLDADNVTAICAAYPRLSRAPKDVQLAARRSVRAMMRTEDEDRTLDAAIGLEAILLKDNAELSFRMAIYASAALCNEYDAGLIYELSKKVYAHRSKIAHGQVDPKAEFEYDGQSWRTAEIAPFLLNALLKSRLLSVPEWTKATIEQRVIDALNAFGGSA